MSIRLTLASHGTQVPSLPALFINSWWKSKFDVLVDLPVSTHRSMLIFSLQTELRKREVFRKLSEKNYLTLIQTVSSSLGSLDEAAMKKALSQTGMDWNDATVTSVITEIKREVTKQITGAGIASILVNDVLQAKFSKVAKLEDVSMASILDAVSRIQELYSMFAASQPLAAVGESINSMLAEVPLMKHVYDTWVIINRHKSATVKGRLTYALDCMFEHTFDEPMMRYDAKIPGMHYHITQVGIVKDLTYKQVVCTYFTSLRGLMGIDAGETVGSVSLSELLDHFLLKIPEGLPSLPRELACSAQELKASNKVFAKLWLMNVYEMIFTKDEGQLAHQISNVMDKKKYLRNETWDKTVNEGIAISSIMFGAYLKTGAQFRDWARDENIYFAADSSLPHNVKRKLNTFVFDVVKGYNTFEALEHPRFLNNPAHIVNFAEQSRVSNNITFMVPDKAISFKKSEWMINPLSLERTLIFKNDKLSGSDIDVQLDVERPLLPMATALRPYLGFEVPRPNLFGGDITAAFLGIHQFEDLAKKTDIPGEIIRSSELVIISSISDLADTFDITEEVATMIWKGPGLYVSLARQGVLYFTWEYSTAPVVELSSTDQSRDYQPFIGKWPYLLIYRNTLPSISGVPGAPKPNPPAPKPGPKPNPNPNPNPNPPAPNPNGEESEDPNAPAV